ncbi:MAG: hypothetical protein F6K16_40695 [Symploca sp. SIO2B6]|nr:hypothetical protein [Symploca sp. SIO2B6]
MAAFSTPSSLLTDSRRTNLTTSFFPSLKQGAIALLSSLSVAVGIGQ